MNGPTTAGQISTFQTTTKENVFLNTNMVCLQAEDHTDIHGIKASFNQTRVLPIVGKTARAEIGVKQIDIQTKILPVFQPQVCLNNTDEDNLVYEVGISAQYRASLIDYEPDGTILPTYDITDDGFSMLFNIGGVAPLNSQWKIQRQPTVQAYPTVSSPPVGSFINLIDSYDQRYQLTSYTAAKDVDLRAVMDKWNGFYQPSVTSQEFELRKTSLTALVIPSVKQKLTSFGPFQSSIEYPGRYFCPVEDTSGFTIGDSVKFFGITDIDNTNVVPKRLYGKVVDVINYALLQSPSSKVQPTLVIDYSPLLSAAVSATTGSSITFTINSSEQFSIFQDALDEYGFYIGQRITCFNGSGTPNPNGSYYISTLTNGTGGRLQIVCNISSSLTFTAQNVTLAIGTIYQGGYIINTHSKDGGHIEFLTNENSFQPFTAVCTNGIIIDDSASQTLLQIAPSFFNNNSTQLPDTTKPYCDWPNMGWLRHCFTTISAGTPLQSQCKIVIKVEVVASNLTSAANIARYRSAFNGNYRIVVDLSDATAKAKFFLVRIDRFIPDGTYNFVTDAVSLRCSLAPNAYTMDTDMSAVSQTETPNIPFSIPNLKWMQTFGFRPTEKLVYTKAQTPPIGPIAPSTWARAYSVDWSFSSYRNLRWKTQDLLARTPSPPIVSQDFTGTYYNVYEMNKFIMDCVNPGIESCIEGPYIRFDFNAMCLNDQLRLAKMGYATAQVTLGVIVWASNVQWEAFVTLAESNTAGARLFLSKREIPAGVPLPFGEFSDENYMYLGRLAVYPGGSPPTNPYQVYFIPSDPTLIAIPTPSPYANFSITNANHGSISVVNPPADTSTPYPRTRTNAKAFALYTPIADQTNPDQNPRESTSRIFGTPYINPAASNLTPYNAADRYRVMFRSDKFNTKPPVFDYDELRLLFTMTYDGYGYGTKQVDMDLPQETQALLQYKRLSWGNNIGSDEWLSFESNSAFKYLFDNFSAYCIPYSDTLPYLRSVNAPIYPFISYWIYDQNDDNIAPSATNQFFTVFQSCESLSSCVSPVQSIVIVSDNIPVVEQLTTPVSYLIDSDSQYYYKNDTVSTTTKIIGEVFLPYVAPHSVRSVIKFEDTDVQFHQLLDTKMFKQVEYSLYYRHRITQQLIPLILTNYGSVNIKFIFRPLEQFK
jgi:hypothetical protein